MRQMIVLTWLFLNISTSKMGAGHQIRRCVLIVSQHLGDVDLLLLLPHRVPSFVVERLALGLVRAGIHTSASFGEERFRGFQEFGLAGELKTLGVSPFASFVAQL